MKQALYWIRAALALAVLALAVHADPSASDYTTLAQPHPTETPGKVEVIEFFSFGCPHCNHYEPYVEAWAARLPRDVVFRREHVHYSSRTDWAPYAKIALTLKMMGKLDVMAQRVFNAVHQQHIELRDESVLFPWIAKQGLDVNTFKSLWNSFGMPAQMRMAEQRTMGYNITGVPTFIVNGKYQVDVAAGDEQGTRLFATISQLIARERAHLHK